MSESGGAPRRTAAGQKLVDAASIELAEARASAASAEADKFKAEKRNEIAKARTAEILLSREQDKRNVELAANDLHNVYIFDSDVSESSVKKCIAQLSTWSRQEPNCKIEIQITSPGGSIFDGFALIDFIRDLRGKGHEVTMLALGMAASMAGVLMQAADVRVMGANALMLIHEGSLGASGDFGNVEDRVKLMELMHQRILTLFEDRATPINPKTTKAFIKRRWNRTDWWIGADDCLKLGLVDEVR